MNTAQRNIRLWVFATVGLGLATYCVAESSMALAILALPLWALAWPMSVGAKGKPLPKALITLIVLAALARSGLRVVNDPHELVTAVSHLMLWMLIAKLYDHWNQRDRSLLLLMSVLLAIGSLLTSNSLPLAAMSSVYLVVMVWTTLRHELASLRDLPNVTPTARPAGLSRRSQRDLARLAGVLGVVSFLFAVVVFVVIPRDIGEGFLGDWGVPAAAPVSGFRDSVTLGAAGLISESQTPILDVIERDASGRNIGSASRPLLLRGAVLDEYQDGRWTRSKQAGQREFEYTVAPDVAQPIAAVNPRTPVYSLDITMRRRPSDQLFTINRPVSITMQRLGQIRVGQRDMQISTSIAGSIRYTVRFQSDDLGAPAQGFTDDLADAPVRDLAASLLQTAGISTDPTQRSILQTRRAADTLVDYLHRNFEYTTRMVAPDAGEDPIDMFLFRTKAGHCEYFASAMTAMSRSIGLDARVVTGYMATEFDESAGVYTVRQSDAHAWVEVKLSNGQWVSYDPSPPDDLAVEHAAPGGLAAMVRSVTDRVSRWWVNSVVAFNETHRRSIVGRDPLRIDALMQGFIHGALMPPKAGGAPILVIALLRGFVAFASTAAAGMALIQLLALFSLYRKRTARHRAELRDNPDAADRIAQRGFYDQTLRALKRGGLAKPSWRPVKAHAASLAPLDHTLAQEVSGVGDLYYASRFGQRLLSTEELQTASDHVRRIAQRLEALRTERKHKPV